MMEILFLLLTGVVKAETIEIFTILNKALHGFLSNQFFVVFALLMRGVRVNGEANICIIASAGPHSSSQIFVLKNGEFLTTFFRLDRTGNKSQTFHPKDESIAFVNILHLGKKS